MRIEFFIVRLESERIKRIETSKPMTEIHNSDDYAATLLAAGPGVLGSALLAVVEFGSFSPYGLFTVIHAYPLALFAFLPGLPIFGYCLSRAIPRRSAMPTITKFMPWLSAAPFGLIWHVAVIDFSFRWWQIESPVDWLVVVRYGICLSVVTAAIWTVHVMRLTDGDLDQARDTMPPHEM